MILGPITISWTKTLKKAQKRDLRQNRCIAGLTHDKLALVNENNRLRQIIEEMAEKAQARIKARQHHG